MGEGARGQGKRAREAKGHRNEEAKRGRGKVMGEVRKGEGGRGRENQEGRRARKGERKGGRGLGSEMQERTGGGRGKERGEGEAGQSIIPGAGRWGEGVAC